MIKISLESQAINFCLNLKHLNKPSENIFHQANDQYQFCGLRDTYYGILVSGSPILTVDFYTFLRVLAKHLRFLNF